MRMPTGKATATFLGTFTRQRYHDPVFSADRSGIEGCCHDVAFENSISLGRSALPTSWVRQSRWWGLQRFSCADEYERERGVFPWFDSTQGDAEGVAKAGEVGLRCSSEGGELCRSSARVVPLLPMPLGKEAAS